jgi:regulator of protease activity HflC (stomatin/prohibitin superfamily)
MFSAGVLVPLLILAALAKSAIHILQEYERGVVFTLGRLSGTRGPGINFVLPFVQRLVSVDQRVITMDVPSQDVISKDNVSIKVNAVLYFRVVDPAKALVNVENYLVAANQLAQTTLRSVCGQVELDDLLADREKVNHRIQDIIDERTEPWGVKVSMVEIKHIDLPQEMQRMMAQQAEADRERRAKIIKADGEYQAATRLREAADILSQNPTTIQLRYLDTLREVSGSAAATIVFPMPLDVSSLIKTVIETKKIP